MGKFEKKEKVGTKLARIAWECVGILIIAVIGYAVMVFLGLGDWLEGLSSELEADVLYCVGLVIIFVADGVFIAVRAAIKKKKTKDKHCPTVSS